MSSSLALMFIYTVIALALQAVCVGAILLVEPFLAGWSGVAFITSYLLTFWLAWSLSVWLTEPKKTEAEAGEVSRA